MLGFEVQDAVMGSRGASSALVNGRVVLVVRRATGVSELGVILDVSLSDSGSSGSNIAGRRVGGGLGLGGDSNADASSGSLVVVVVNVLCCRCLDPLR